MSQDPNTHYGATPENPYVEQQVYQEAPQQQVSDYQEALAKQPFGAPPPQNQPSEAYQSWSQPQSSVPPLTQGYRYEGWQQPSGGAPPLHGPYRPGAFPGYQQGYNSYGYGAPHTTPLSLSVAIRQLPSQYIKVLTQPSVRTFSEEAYKADWNIVLVQLLLYTLVPAILFFLSMFITSNLTYFMGIEDLDGLSIGMLLMLYLVLAILFAVSTPISFFIEQGIQYGLAKAFKGQGSFVQQCYTAMLYSTPLYSFSMLVSMIPIIGTLLPFALGIYRIVVNVFALMGVHRLSGGKATAVILIPVAVGVGLYVVMVLIVVALIFAIFMAAMVGSSS